MAEQGDKPDAVASAANDAPKDGDNAVGKHGGNDVDWGEVKDRFVGLLASVVRWVCLIFALILVLYIVFTVAEANPENGIVEFVRSWADGLTLGVGDLFLPEDDKLRVLVNYGIAAMIWLIIGSLGSRLVRMVGGVKG